MVVVRFPSGLTVQYNDANFISRSVEYTDIYTKKDGIFIAQAPNSCIIEYKSPCQVYNPIHGRYDNILYEIRLLKNAINKLARKESK